MDGGVDGNRRDSNTIFTAGEARDEMKGPRYENEMDACILVRVVLKAASAACWTFRGCIIVAPQHLP